MCQYNIAMNVILVLGLCYLVTCSSAQCPADCSCIRGNTRIRCSAARLTEVPNFSDTIRQTAQEIDLSANNISHISANDFQGFSNLETLDLAANRINFIEQGSFSSTVLLETLMLSSNMLRVILDNLFQSTSLLTLDLSNNLIVNISMLTFSGVQEDAIIRLDGNRIQTIHEDTFTSVRRVHELGLTRNPLRCDCELRWFPAFRDSIRAVSGIGTCDAPPNLNGEAIQDLTEDDFMCNCIPPCMNGTCNTTIGECDCDDGYRGESCNLSCLPGTFGDRCLGNCSCVEGHNCDNVNGTCDCLPGFTGLSCKEECPEGFYGDDCLDICQECLNEGECDHVTGECHCTDGWAGLNCQTRNITFTATLFPTYGVVLLALFGGLVLIFIVAAVIVPIVVWKVHKTTTKQRKVGASPKPSQTEDQSHKLKTTSHSHTVTPPPYTDLTTLPNQKKI